MSNSNNLKWSMFDLLDPFQLGVLYESLMINEAEARRDGNDAAHQYLEFANVVRGAIETNCGWDDYVCNYQRQCQRTADYDNRGGYNPPASALEVGQ